MYSILLATLMGQGPDVVQDRGHANVIFAPGGGYYTGYVYEQPKLKPKHYGLTVDEFLKQVGGPGLIVQTNHVRVFRRR